MLESGKLTKKEAIDGTREMWGEWLAKDGTRKKEDWPGWERNGGKYPKVISDCLLCNYAEYCMDCPLIWPGQSGMCMNTDKEPGLFRRWFNSKSKKRCERLARRIAELPEKE